MNNKQRTKNAFTLIELTVAVALLAMVLSFASMIFRFSIDGFRIAGANAEVMQKLRAITDQLNSDLKGLRKDAPLLIWFRQDPNDADRRYDQIMFFAAGDFQSTQLYRSSQPVYIGEELQSSDKIIRGNVARIYYGQATVDSAYPWNQKNDDEQILARRRHILTADKTLDEWPDPNNVDTTFNNSYGGYKKNECYEHDSLSLSQWKRIDRDTYNNPVLNACFDVPAPIDMNDLATFHKLMCEGVGSFAIQWAYWEPFDKELRWFPSDDPDGDGSKTDSHFDLVNTEHKFGGFFIPNISRINYWYPVGDIEYNSGDKFSSTFYPKALKFTFTLYDSKGILKQGRTFTHIVYLED